MRILLIIFFSFTLFSQENEVSFHYGEPVETIINDDILIDYKPTIILKKFGIKIYSLLKLEKRKIDSQTVYQLFDCNGENCTPLIDNNNKEVLFNLSKLIYAQPDDKIGPMNPINIVYPFPVLYALGDEKKIKFFEELSKIVRTNNPNSIYIGKTKKNNRKKILIKYTSNTSEETKEITLKNINFLQDVFKTSYYKYR